MNESKSENSFRNILKASSIFGGVQVFNILISAIRLKFVAVILGPSGMGVAGLFYSASLTIQQFASLGLNLSIVKEIASSKEDEGRMRHLLAALRPLILASAALGALVCIAFPGLLSKATFGSNAFTSGFLLMSAAVFFSILGVALMSILQGLHAVKPLSKASLVGSSVGLAVGVPLYWLMGTRGIVPAMVALSFATCLWYWLSLRKVLEVESAEWDREKHLPLLKRILLMGLLLMSNDLFRNLCNFLVNIFVSRNGGLDDVGFFQSCNNMTMQYSAIVFTAMAMDYLPRLSATTGDNSKMCGVVNRQIEVVGLMITPIICGVVLFSPLVIEVLQTSKFLVAVPLLRLLAMAVAIRALMYPLGYIAFAKDNRKLFFWMESVGANLLTLSLSCCGYWLWGLYGLGIASVIDCCVCLAVYIIVNRKLYGYRFSSISLRIAFYVVAASAAMLGMTMVFSGGVLYAAGGGLLISTGVFSFVKIRKRISLPQ